MSARFDAIVIGGGVSGLTAASYIARAGRKVVLLEARESLGGRAETVSIAENVRAPLVAHTVYALDARIVRDLKLHRRGLDFAERAMPLVALHLGGRHLTLAHDIYAARAVIRAQAAEDADAYLRFKRETASFARRMRPLWAPERPGSQTGGERSDIDTIASALELSPKETDRLDGWARSSATAYLDGWFETDALKAALALDAEIDGVSPQEAGSALALLWRAAQESSGMQGAVSQIRGGPGALVDALAHAGRDCGADLRTGIRVSNILVEDATAIGVTTDDGEELRAGAVLSSLSTSQTLLDLVPPESITFGAAARISVPTRLAAGRVYFVLDGLPPFAGLPERSLRGRMIVAERPESAAEAKGAALLGQLPAELVLEVTVPTIADPDLSATGQHVLSVRVPYLPAALEGGWGKGRDILRKRVLSGLEVFAPGLRDRVNTAVVLTPEDIEARYGAAHTTASTVRERLLSTYESRVRTPIAGLYLCGNAAEPADAISGRAGRLAVQMFLAERNAGRGRHTNGRNGKRRNGGGQA